ncbi:MAG: FecR family protein, partial [Candidatus Gracilibacteria bacterium]|nr:FecR family protein [Candidatus Gracilibacteria bacterium]
MDQKQKMIAMLVAVGILAGAGIGYIWFAGNPITQEVAYQIQGKLNTTSSSGSLVITDTTVGYVSEIEGIGKLNRKGNESLIQKEYILQSGDIVSTESGSTIEIIFADNSFVRIEENSKLIIASMNEVELKNGGLWARILKPLQDTSIFTIKASDLSAGVRGTVVRTTTSSGEMRIDVIDTTIGTGSAVDVTVNTSSGILQESLSDEESLTILKNLQKKVKLNMDQMLQDEVIRDNLKKDILLMHRMMTESMNTSHKTPITMMEIPKDQFQKMNQEIIRSLPKSNELNKFFVSQIIEDDARQLGMFSTAFSASKQDLSAEEQVQLLIS